MGALVAYVALVMVGRWLVLGEIASQFLFYFGIGALGAAALFLVARQARMAAVALAMALWGCWPEASLYLGSTAAGPDAPAISPHVHVVSANVLRPNTRYEEVLDAVLQTDPDVIGLLELSPAWRDAAIKRLGERYPYHATAANTRGWNKFTWGLMLFSKIEIASAKELRLDFDEWELRPVLEVKLKAPFDLTISLAHPERPGRPARMRARRTALERLAASGVDGHWLVTGDLNTTSTSPLFRDILNETGLRDSRAGFGRQPTWEFGERLPGPLPLPLPKWARLSVAIDHALCSPGLEVHDRRTFSIPGSDHRGVSVTLAPK